MAQYLERTPTLYQGMDVLELGAGAGLPGLLVAKSGARTVRALRSRVLSLN
jgi:predicted nicotinamide N-methyase